MRDQLIRAVQAPPKKPRRAAQPTAVASPSAALGGAAAGAAPRGESAFQVGRIAAAAGIELSTPVAEVGGAEASVDLGAVSGIVVRPDPRPAALTNPFAAGGPTLLSGQMGLSLTASRPRSMRLNVDASAMKHPIGMCRTQRMIPTSGPAYSAPLSWWYSVGYKRSPARTFPLWLEPGVFEATMYEYWGSDDAVHRIIPSDFNWIWCYSDHLTDTGLYFYAVIGGEAVLRARRPLFAGPMTRGTHFDLVTISHTAAMDQIRALYDAPAPLMFSDDFGTGDPATHIVLLDAFYENLVDLNAYWDDPELSGAMRGGTTTLLLEDVGVPYLTDLDVHLAVTCNGSPVDTSSVRLDLSSHRKSTTGASRRAGSARLTYGLEPDGGCSLKNGW